MSTLYKLFSVPVFRFTEDETYDEVQIEIRDSLKVMRESGDLSCCSERSKTKEKKNYNFVEKYKCSKLESKIKRACSEYIKNSQWRAGINGNLLDSVVIENSWVNFNSQGESRIQHVHPGHQLSGVYYFRVNEDQGGIVFQNPNPIANICDFPSGNIFPYMTNVIPFRGDIILFPSWLSHGTVENRSNDERISIAFNVNIENLDRSMINRLIKSSHPQITTTEFHERI